MIGEALIEIEDILIPLAVTASLLFIWCTLFTNRLVRIPELSRRQQLFAKFFFAFVNILIAILVPFLVLTLIHSTLIQTTPDCHGCFLVNPATPLSAGELILTTAIFIVLPLLIIVATVYVMGSLVHRTDHLGSRWRVFGYAYSLMLGLMLATLFVILLGPTLLMTLRPIFFSHYRYSF